LTVFALFHWKTTGENPFELNSPRAVLARRTFGVNDVLLNVSVRDADLHEVLVIHGVAVKVD